MTPWPLSAHLGYLFSQLPLRARPASARAAGFQAVEHPAPFEVPAAELDAILRGEGLGMTQISSGMGAPGEKGLASLPGREDEFRHGFARAMDYAEEIGCPYLHPMAGVNGDRSTYRANIEAALRLAEGRGVRVLVEAISAGTVPGYMMATPHDLLALAAEHPQLRVLVDSFHVRACGEDPAQVVRAAGAALGHIHIADYPGRHQPGTGTTDFAALLLALADLRYEGAIGCEYLPDGEHHLGWMPRFKELAGR